MKVKRYEGKSEAVLMPIITAEMGPGATIISVKEKAPTGLFSFLKRPTVVITAACEEDADLINLLGRPQKGAETQRQAPTVSAVKPIEASVVNDSKDESPQAIEESMNLLLQEARKAANQIEQDEATKRLQRRVQAGSKPITVPSELPEPQESQEPPEDDGTMYKNSTVQLFYETMTQQDVLPEVAQHILQSLENFDDKSQVDVKFIIKAIYGAIVDMLKDPELISTRKEAPQTVVFMGPTGVGKTTTIAKLSSILALKHGIKVGLITADTYRIAAVEQLRTYADILGLDIRVVYSPSEMYGHLADLSAKCDIILVDTAGRSHRDFDKMRELKEILSAMPVNSKNYLVLSITTRYSDLCKTVSVFDGCADFSLIFTKLDESETLGSLLNVCCLTGKKAAYVTFGQNVPDDLETIKPDKIAKSLLGLGDSNSHSYSTPEVGK